jgi:hypothetical protein
MTKGPAIPASPFSRSPQTRVELFAVGRARDATQAQQQEIDRHRHETDTGQAGQGADHPGIEGSAVFLPSAGPRQAAQEQHQAQQTEAHQGRQITLRRLFIGIGP